MKLEKEKLTVETQKKYKKQNQSLDLNSERLRWADFITIREWSMIKILKLKFCGINDTSIEVLLNLNWPELVEINLENNQITGQGFQKLMDTKLTKLSSIKIGFNKINEMGIKYLIDCAFTNIQRLQLTGNNIGNIGIKYLAKISLQNLNFLQLNMSGVGGEGMKHLIKSQWPNINELWLGYHTKLGVNTNPAKMEGWEALYQNNWRSLSLSCIRQKQPVYFFYYILLPRFSSEIHHYTYDIDNQQLSQFINRTLWNRTSY